MANSRAFLVFGFLGIAMALSTTLSSATSKPRTHSTNYHSVSYGGDSPTLTTYTYRSCDLGIITEEVRIPVDKIVYTRLENSPKYNNRLKGHAQEWRDQNVKAKIVFS